MAIISKKKRTYPVSAHLNNYLNKYDRYINLNIDYEDLVRYDNSIPLYDHLGNDTLWETVFYPQSDMGPIYQSLIEIYGKMKVSGDMRVMEHLIIDRVDLCVFGNTQPFRIRVVNKINDNFDYFYIKKADASRIYGLELEHLLSPNKIAFFVHNDTLIEEHIIGIPAHQFIQTRMNDSDLNRIRLAKEFVKFNERCFVRLLGDMHSSNFVVDITPDFEEVDYRLRSIDFDQQSYEGRRAIYMPKYYKQNNPIIKLGMDMMTPETMHQYMREERSMMVNRINVESKRVNDLLSTMKKDKIAPEKNVHQLRDDLAQYYDEVDFLKCKNMGEILEMSLKMLYKKADVYQEDF